ncbi:MAG: hypothetical protein RLZZ516_1882 [Cyanobacteriota bacterium]
MPAPAERVRTDGRIVSRVAVLVRFPMRKFSRRDSLPPLPAPPHYDEPAWRLRFRALGMDEPTVQAVMASRNSKVFSLDHALLERTLHEAGLEPPTQLLQALFTHLWVSRRPPLQCEGGPDA